MGFDKFFNHSLMQKHLPPISMGVEGEAVTIPEFIPTVNVRLCSKGTSLPISRLNTPSNAKAKASNAPETEPMISIDESFYNGLQEAAMSNLKREIEAIEKFNIRPWSASSRAASELPKKPTVDTKTKVSGGLNAVLQGIPILNPIMHRNNFSGASDYDDDSSVDIDTLGGGGDGGSGNARAPWTPLWTGPTQPRQPLPKDPPPEGITGIHIGPS
jgi:hypothetical protein